MVEDSYGVDINYPANELVRAAVRPESVMKVFLIQLPSAGSGGRSQLYFDLGHMTLVWGVPAQGF